jgi:Tfp pilus assembly protein PilN
MRNLEVSPFLESPTLVVLKEGAGEKQNLSEFTLTVNLTREKSREAQQGKAQKPNS